jgi:hypothetical protein
VREILNTDTKRALNLWSQTGRQQTTRPCPPSRQPAIKTSIFACKPLNSCCRQSAGTNDEATYFSEGVAKCRAQQQRDGRKHQRRQPGHTVADAFSPRPRHKAHARATVAPIFYTSEVNVPCSSRGAWCKVKGVGSKRRLGHRSLSETEAALVHQIE